MEAVSQRVFEHVDHARGGLAPHERAAVEQANLRPAIRVARGYVRDAEAELEHAELYSRHEAVRGLLSGDLDERLPEIEKAEGQLLALRRRIERWQAVVSELERRSGITRDAYGNVISH